MQTQEKEFKRIICSILSGTIPAFWASLGILTVWIVAQRTSNGKIEQNVKSNLLCVQICFFLATYIKYPKSRFSFLFDDVKMWEAIKHILAGVGTDT